MCQRFPLALPVPAAAIAHPSPWLYTDSDVNLDAATGKLRWYYQGVTNDFMDHDMQTSPIGAAISGAPGCCGVSAQSANAGNRQEMIGLFGAADWEHRRVKQPDLDEN